mmetsp:Transcript_8320/g.12409  ORF Transcript_8320/g.12409 Transcript_8320/m.12409 type:complete len:311 (-) Transcript_8320:40-972(-)
MMRKRKPVDESDSETVSRKSNKNENNAIEPTMASTNSKLSILQEKFQKKLEGARFRMINESLYTQKGEEAFEEFQKDPLKFDIYHKGFREQAAQWPENPLHRIVDWLIKYHPSAVVADMGCGEAHLALSVKNKVHSFDLVAVNERIIACDMAHVPLKDGSVDIVVFCLALMGVNIGDFIREAHRVLKSGGILKVVEVRSRFDDSSTGGGIKKFLKFLKRAGFDLSSSTNDNQSDQHNSSNNNNNNNNKNSTNSNSNSKVTSKGSSKDIKKLEKSLQPPNKMFFDVECRKSERDPQIDVNFSVKACVYKKR